MQWRRLTPAREKYIVFPPGVDFSTVLAERGLGRIAWDPAQLEEMFHMAEAATDGRASPTSTKRVSASASPKKASPRKAKKDRHIEQPEDEQPSGTAVSAGEVEEAVAFDDADADVSLGGQMNVDADFEQLETGVASQEQMDVDEEAGPSKRPPLSKRGPPSKRAAVEEAPSADTSSKRRLVRRFTPRNTDDEVSAAPAGASSPKRPARTYGSAKAKEDAFTGDSPRSSPSPVKKPQSSRRRVADPDEDVEMDEPVEVQAPSKNKPKKTGPPGIRVTKVKAAPPPPPPEPKKRSALDELLDGDSDSSDEEDVRSVLGDLVKNGRTSRTGATRNADSKSGQTPQRLDSVLVPTVESIYGSPTKKGGKAEALGTAKATAKTAAPKGTRKPPAPMDPPPVAAKKPTRAPSPVESERSASPPPRKPARKVKPAPAEVPEAGPSRAPSDTSPTKTGRTPSRRSAATKATQKLHDVIMPDLVSFQKEMKNGTVRSAHEIEQSAAKGKGRASEPGAGAELKTKGKKRPSLGSGDEEAEEEMPEKKKRKAADADAPATKGKKKGPGPRKSAAAETSVEPQSQESATGGRRKSLAAVTDNEPARAEAKGVRVMTTQLSFPDEVMRVSAACAL